MTDKAKALSMIDFTKSPQEIADQLMERFKPYSDYRYNYDSDCHTQEVCSIQCAIKAVEIALQVCSSREWDHDHGEYYTPSRHTKLTEVLQILKSKI